jgi:hypothetical protein
MKTISIKLSDLVAEHLRRMAHEKSLEKDFDVSLSDLIRDALYATYKIPDHSKLVAMYGKQK